GARSGRVMQGARRDRNIVEAVPEWAVRQSEPDLGHARIVRVEDRMRALGEGAEGPLDLLGDRLELPVAVELVPEQVEHERRPGLDLVYGFGQAGFVDLENPPVGLAISVVLAQFSAAAVAPKN